MEGAGQSPRSVRRGPAKEGSDRTIFQALFSAAASLLAESGRRVPRKELDGPFVLEVPEAVSYADPVDGAPA